MAKAVKKKGKNRRLKRSVRKTLGALFLASALAVAAIPTEGLLAADGDAALPPTAARVDRPHTGGAGDTDPMKVSIAGLKETVPTGSAWSKTAIPDVTGSEFDNKVYTSENLNLQFVVANMHTQNAYAVIVGYNNQMQQNNVGDKLTIPRTVDAYTTFMGRSCAIGGNNGELLFYRAQVGTEDTVSGNDIVQVPHYEYRPCLFDNIATWQTQEYDENTNPTEGLFFISGLTAYNDPNYRFDDDGVPYMADGSPIPESTWRRAQSTLTQRIKGIPVYYIGNQYVNVGATSKTEAQDVTPEHGIFSGANVNSLVVEPNLVGIGSYAFAGTDIKTVELSNTIKEIGNYAFSGCPSLSTFKIDDTATSVVIGDHAFANCASLVEFDAKKVIKIGDSAFEGCGRLARVNLLIEGDTGALQNLGYYAFAACTSLKEIVFPVTYAEVIPISTFMRCISLNHIYATGNWPTMNFEEKDKDYYSFENFRLDCAADFYFEGARGCDLETTVVPNYFAYKFTGEEVYEKRVPDEASRQDDGSYRYNATFQVTREGQTNIGAITRVQIDPGLQNLKIPGVVGPLSITAIGEGGFEDNCDLTSVVIPPTITSIGVRAFKGCHNLNSVIFEDASKISRANIGADAFATQSLGTGHNCSLSSDPKLYFTGAVQSDVGPFQYAMDKDVYISAGSQTPTHITYYSGWPSNLTVENVDGVATLTNYPTIQQLMQQGGSFNKDNYPYFTMNENYEPAAYVAFYKYLGMDASQQSSLESFITNKYPDYDLQFGSLNGYETEIIQSTLNVLIPEGVVAIEEGLFDRLEAEGDYKYLQSTGDLRQDTITSGDAVPVDRLISTKTNQPLGKTFTVNFREITADSFANCKMLETVNIGSGTESIGDHAFQDCSFLENVNIGPNVKEMGIAPFIRCNKLDRVNLNYIQPNNNFLCEESVLFGRAADGSVTKIIEYLNGADYQVPSRDVLAKTTEIAQEAFKDTNVQTADFSESSITTVPRYAFANTKSLQNVTIPHTVTAIEGFAFENSNIRFLYNIPSTLYSIESTAFDGVPNYCTLYSPEGSIAQRFSHNNPDHPNLKWQKETEIAYYTINFFYEDAEGNKVYVHTEENVKAGDSVDVDRLLKEGAFDELPKEINGLVFKRTWLPKDNYINVSGDTSTLEVRAVYGEASKHTITFLGEDDSIIDSREVFVGGTLYIPPAPLVEGKTFSGWRYIGPELPGTYTLDDIDTVEDDMNFQAVYTLNGGGDNPGGDTPGGDNPGGDNPGGDNPGGDNPGG
ncbi:MAG: leucine-rich repeat domain-containing protein, partial [Acetatifactor sp.]|nr:leucine-rich repeat domain-containing protein [Acetatifactor sp.]